MDQEQHKRTNLPPLSTQFVGRDAELHQLGQWLEESRRPITILGPPGAGKTRLLQEIGHRFLSDLKDSQDSAVWFIDLSKARSLTDIVMSTATDLDVPLLDETASALETLGRAIEGRKRILLLFDNFEQLVQHAQDSLGYWLSVAPLACVVVSSRERLLLPGECLLTLGPLGLPVETCGSVDEFVQTEAGRLLVDRIRSVRSGYRPEPGDVPTLTTIVRRLDGLPLALELAAARFTVLDPAQLLPRLERRFEVLAHRSHTETRHSSLRTCIDWSWDLLEPIEQNVLAQCSIFRGGFDIDAAEAIIDTTSTSDAPAMLDVLQSLWEKSLLVIQKTTDSPSVRHFRLLESIAEFAAERLSETDRDAVIARRAEYFATTGLRWVDEFIATGSPAALAELKRLWDGLWIVFESLDIACSSDTSTLDLLLQVALALDSVLHNQGPSDVHRDLLERALSRVKSDCECSPILVARVQLAKARLLSLVNNSDDAMVLFEEVKNRAEKLGDFLLLGRVENELARFHRVRGRTGQAMGHAEQAAIAFQRVGNRYLTSSATYAQAFVVFGRGQTDEARTLLVQALDGLPAQEGSQLEGQILASLAYVDYVAGRLDLTPSRLQEAIRIFRRGGFRNEADALYTLGAVYLHLGKWEEAENALNQVLRLAENTGHRESKAWAYGRLGHLKLDQGDLAAAGPILNAALDQAGHDGHTATAAMARYGLVMKFWLDGDLDSALTAVCEFDSWDLALASALAAARDQLEQATQLLDTAREAAKSGFGLGPAFFDTLELCCGHIDLAQARREEREGRIKQAGALVEKARSRLLKVHRNRWSGSRYTAPEVSFDVRMFARLLLISLPENVQIQATIELRAGDIDAFIVDERGRWFRPPGGAWVDLTNRRQLCQLLAGLLEVSQQKPPTTLSFHDVVDLLWPDERILPEAAANRVYKTISVLRNSGLGKILLSGTEGYCLDPNVTVIAIPGELSQIQKWKHRKKGRNPRQTANR